MDLCTPRLRLRPWTDADREPFAAMSGDPGVSAFLLPFATRADSDGWIDRQIAHQAREGFCFWVVEHRETRAFVGAVGLLRIGYHAPFTPAVEVGWRIAPAHWGRGYAPEAAAASLDHAFGALALPQVVANTAPANIRSRRVMAKLGMGHDPADDFDHPRIPLGHPLRRQVLYRVTPDAWASHRQTLANPALPTLEKDSTGSS